MVPVSVSIFIPIANQAFLIRYSPKDFNKVVAEDVNEDVNEVFDGDGTEDVKKASKELVSSESQGVFMNEIINCQP